MSAFHLLTELTGITSPTLADEQALAALAVAAGGALGLTAHGPPQVRSGPRGIAVGMLGHGGHIVLHADPGLGRCLVDIVTPTATPPARGLEVVARRLGVPVSPGA
jgi:S-adenosylmethionine/arginine decarboxylase-like enzyme